MGAEKSPTCLHPSKKNPGKVPKRIHKAEREKMKREHLNELFLELAGALELTEQNSGKASILGETTRVVKDMLDQIKSLKKENAALLSESQYVTVERNELQDETCALQKQISELKSVIKERTVQKNLDLNAPAMESQEPQLPQYLPHDIIRLPPGNPLLNSVVVIPACHNVQIHTRPDSGLIIGNKPVSNVSKPYPRYPTPSDSWPFQLLEKAGEDPHREGA
ncbi:transcription factor bHLH47-like [Cynara cardunculus var. scolymus]|uniref:transcription factor bHLH47-like n=1 Tax=Cynara cardunculus var. scolymus TaxID=59895 RepID=UPI000D631356|nr:transcription factor bHLH47-like [Cynara cardunculus var. scolymus]XP_024977327.1 transcription factor bHLH47-like [Cynara cardunculus var. scolymus]XP_024977329.1 transcription factor bHLH47-like [Cynara cardunculus var. scolymus]